MAAQKYRASIFGIKRASKFTRIKILTSGVTPRVAWRRFSKHRAAYAELSCLRRRFEILQRQSGLNFHCLTSFASSVIGAATAFHSPLL